MTQYQPPYQPPQPPSYPADYYGAYADPLSAARRASILMFVMGALAMVCGAFMLLVGAVVTPDLMGSSPQAQQFQQLESQVGVSFRVIMLVTGAIILLPGLLLLALGFWVRRGSAVAAGVAIGLSSMIELLLLINLVGTLFRGGDVSQLAVGLCMIVVCMGLCALLIVWLLQAFRAAPLVAAWRQQYQAQYWQAQQQQQAYPAQGYGYGAPPAAQLPAPLPHQMPYPQTPPPSNTPGADSSNNPQQQ